MRRIAPLLTLCSLLVACGGDASLTEAEREWCSYADDSAASAERFDLIFEMGLALGLDMDTVNAHAAGLRAEYEAEGLTASEAIARVSADLLETESYAEACRAAFAEHGP